ncbi:hypothetical protein tb265_25060 [Gemmatimonadetes bacterium T265]|nr:hypothetical protein tb265_25060 [Gemmatimonadetes bacterium T265]
MAANDDRLSAAMPPKRSSSPPPRVFVSYSHDSDAHRARVLTLADRLRTHDRIDARLDRYVEGTPAETWPIWMAHQIEDADFVLVVCTAAYERRALKRELPGKGLGAAWEGGIVTQLVYEHQGRTTKFVPVVFGDSDLAHIPVFLRGATHYDVSAESGYQALYDYLTGYHDTPMPALGAGRPARTSRTVASPVATSIGRKVAPSLSAKAAPARDAGRAARRGVDAAVPRAKKAPSRRAFSGRAPVVLRFDDGHVAAFGADRIEAGQTLVLDLVPLTPDDGVRLQALQAATGPSAYGRTAAVAVAYGVPPVITATWARVRDVSQEIVAGTARWRLTLEPRAEAGGLMDEMSTNGYSADDIAELRARRILLDDRASTRPAGDPRPGKHPNEARLDPMVAMFVSGAVSGAARGGEFSLPAVEASPLPALDAAWSADRPSFLVAARLTAALWLVLTRVVAQVRKLDVADAGASRLSVDFEGVRRKLYENAPAAIIRVAGECPLRS